MEPMERREVRVCQDLQVHQVSRDQEANLVSMETLDPLDQKDLADSPVQWDLKVTQGAKEAMGSKGQEAFLVLLEMQGKEVLEAFAARLDPRVQSESQVLPVAEECQDLMDPWDPKVNQETEVCREFRDQKASLETLVGQEPLDFKV